MIVIQKEILTPSEVAERLRLSEETVLRLLRSKEIPGFKVGKSWRIKSLELEQYIEDQKKK